MVETSPSTHPSSGRDAMLAHATAVITVVDQMYSEPDNTTQIGAADKDTQVPGAPQGARAAATPPPPSTPSPPTPSYVEPLWVTTCRKYLPESRGQIILMDKVTFSLGILNIIVTSLLFAYPRHFIRLFIAKSILLLSCRWLYYRLKGWHYYLLEFCYVAIALGIIQPLLFSTHPGFHKLVFSLMAGVLTPAVVATRNSFVLHSVDKITSLFQHLTPALIAWMIRWRTAEVIPGYDRLSEGDKADFARAGFVELTLWPMGVWAAWASVYYLVIFVMADHKVQQRDYVTMYKHQTKSPSSPVSKIVKKFKNKYAQYAAYMAFHGGCCSVGFLLNNLWFHSFYLHSLFVLAVLAASIWNGATFYMEIFAQRYQQGLPPSQATAPKKSS